MPTTGLVLAAGGSLRLGEAKQLLPYRGRTLLDATLDMARSCEFGTLLVTLGGAAGVIRSRVDLSGCVLVDNPDFSVGCSSSIQSAIPHVPAESDRLVLLLGDQPGISPSDVHQVAAAPTPLAVCRYTNGLGHPFAFDKSIFPDLSAMHGDKAVWKLLHSGLYPVTEVHVERPVPIDVDTQDDYERLLAEM